MKRREINVYFLDGHRRSRLHAAPASDADAPAGAGGVPAGTDYAAQVASRAERRLDPSASSVLEADETFIGRPGVVAAVAKVPALKDDHLYSVRRSRSWRQRQALQP
jgi:hypothetical protein